MNVRIKAFAVHLAVSAVVVGTALSLVYFLWYPYPFAHVQKVGSVTLALVCVDLVMGPLLTYIVFKPGKKGLKFDLAMIGMLQVAALCYGMKITFEQRPVYAVYNEGRFSTVNPEEYIDIETKKTPRNHPYPRMSLTGPVWVGAKRPSPISRADRIYIEISSQSNGGLRQMPRFYLPYEGIQREAAAAGKKIGDIDFSATVSTAPLSVANPSRLPVKPAQREAVRRWVDGLGVPSQSVVLLPLVGSGAVGLVALDGDSGTILDTLGVAPWWAY